MEVGLSPYDVSRSSPAMGAALLLARTVTTLAPEAAEDRGPVARLAREWAWTTPLWGSGVLVNAASRPEAALHLAQTRAALRDDPWLGPVSAMATSHAEKSPADQSWADVLHGGVSPAMTVALETTVHWLSAVRDLVVFIDRRVGRTRPARAAWTLAAPVLLPSSGAAAIEAREVFGAPSARFAAALEAAADDAAILDPGASIETPCDLKSAAEAFEEALLGPGRLDAERLGRLIPCAFDFRAKRVSALRDEAAGVAARLLGKTAARAASDEARMIVRTLTVRRLPWDVD